MWLGKHYVCTGLLVLLVLAVGEVRSQNSENPLTNPTPHGPPPPHYTSPPHPLWFVNGPTGFSVEGEHHRVTGVRDYINGPTGTSVDRQEDRPRGTYISGPSQTSVFTQERNADEAEEAALEVHLEKSTDDQDATADNVTAIVDPTTIPAAPSDGEGDHVATEVEQGQDDGTLNEDGGATEGELQPEEEEVKEEEAGGAMRSAGRGIINTHPDEGPEDAQILPPGLHIDTTDGSRDASDWVYAGGEWARMNLPDPAHPGIPTPTLPSPAYVVVTNEYLKKVTMKREFRRMTNLSLHYSFFLSQGEGPPGVPQLEVYHVVNDTTTQLLAKETSRGAWSDRTIRVPDTSDTFSIVFLARRMKEGNEIALDDITTSGTSLGDPISSSDVPVLQEPEESIVPGQDTAMQTHDIVNATQLLDDDKFTDNQTSIITLDGINATTQGEETITSPTDTENVEISEKTETTGNVNIVGTHLVPNDTMDDSVKLKNNITSSSEWTEEIVQLQNDEDEKGTHKKLAQSEHQFTADANTTIGKSVSLGISPTMETNVTIENNQTQNTEDTTNLTSISSTNKPTDGNETTSEMPHILDNMTQSVTTSSNNLTTDSINSTLNTQPPKPSSGEELSSLQTTESLNNKTTTTSNSEDTSDIIPLNINRTSTSGAVTPTINMTISPLNTTTGIDEPIISESTTTSWRVFQVFLVLCAIGFLGLGFLYWKKKRRQEDEIPVFTRPYNTDYHNPTFNMDDDASFVSRGGKHNYKSFD
ncbi:hypothetical protein Pcinc_010497 [Petrolisthes cinctipes]|uniref:Uncharacterized protein n=1 Tax=Petrolisthes cinctipes TaxID=88211 RepID=A0AAE1KVC4_PETCI|nr:hypothetical protein Pcinc_010497 [Petrolisthes cinctipes]